MRSQLYLRLKPKHAEIINAALEGAISGGLVVAIINILLVMWR